MYIVVAPDSFKGSLSAVDVGKSMEKGILKVMPHANVMTMPMSDGGEGLVESLVMATGGRFVEKMVTGPLGNPVKAQMGLLGDGETAVVEMAQASGLPLVPEGKRNPLITTTYGTGELIREALDRKCQRLIIGIGGSATNDGGAGMAQALGVRLLDDAGKPLSYGGAELARLANIDISSLDLRITNLDIKVACDVDNPLTGPRGAAAVYGPQKGATPEMVKQLDTALAHYASVMRRDLQVDVEGTPGAGAAGGLGAGLMGILKGELVSGIELVMDVLKLDEHLERADLVFTGEGKLDFQSAFGKVPVGIAMRARKYNVPVVVVAGTVTADADALHEKGITAYFSITSGPMSLKEAMGQTASLVQQTTTEIIRLWGTGGDKRK